MFFFYSATSSSSSSVSICSLFCTRFSIRSFLFSRFAFGCFACCSVAAFFFLSRGATLHLQAVFLVDCFIYIYFISCATCCCFSVRCCCFYYGQFMFVLDIIDYRGMNSNALNIHIAHQWERKIRRLKRKIKTQRKWSINCFPFRLQLQLKQLNRMHNMFVLLLLLLLCVCFFLRRMHNCSKHVY